MKLKIKIPGGEFKTVSLDPTTTARELKTKLMDLLDIANCTGFTLYKYLNGVEYKLEDTEIMSDVICSMSEDYMSHPIGGAIFGFKKRLINSNAPSKNEVEEMLIMQQVNKSFLFMRFGSMNQALESFRNGQFPIEPSDVPDVIARVIHGLYGSSIEK
jgi:hypothetical protein